VAQLIGWVQRSGFADSVTLMLKNDKFVERRKHPRLSETALRAEVELMARCGDLAMPLSKTQELVMYNYYSVISQVMKYFFRFTFQKNIQRNQFRMNVFMTLCCRLFENCYTYTNPGVPLQ